MSDLPLSSRIGVVTGATAGIGLATAEHLAQLGCRLVVNARREDRLHALVERLNAGHGAPLAVAVAGDAADAQVVERVLDAAHERFGAEADLVVVNAGRGLKGSVLDSRPEDWEALMRINVFGAAHLMRRAAQRMLHTLDQVPWEQRARDIIVLGSVVGRNVSPFSSMYGSSKFAVHGMAEGLRRQVASKGVRVTLIAPGFVRSEFQGVAGYDPAWFREVEERIGPVLTPADVARLIGFVAGQPPHAHVADIVIRPTRQDYP